MMATTHGFMGLALAAGVAFVAPDLALPAAVAGVLGGVFPDLDVFADHRRTLHFPVYYSVLTVPAVALAVVATGPVTVALVLFMAAAALHAAGDAFGGSAHVRPWAVEDDRAVYVHVTGTWARCREWIRYDGAPEDFALGAVLAAPALVAFDGPLRVAIAVGLLVSLAWTAFRKPIGRRLDGSADA